MNYAEDRLDRRARTSAACSAAATADGLSSVTGKTSTVNELERDLNLAHEVIRRNAGCHPSLDDEINRDQVKDLTELLEAHRLAGKTLRDGGSNRQAVFHFGVAWKLCYILHRCISRGRNVNAYSNGILDDINVPIICQEWEAAGDYAQMAEFTGFPEVGVMALLFYRAGSFGNCQDECFVSINVVGETNSCRCGLVECGISPCYIAFPTSSRAVNDILSAFGELAQTRIPNNESKSPSALEILNQLALLSGKSSSYTSNDRLLKIHQYMKMNMQYEIPSILQFWDDNNLQPMHSVLLLLLLKLLYSSTIAGPFLHLACYAVPYISAILPTTSIEGRHLAKHYKSHWAYYIFIRALVLGERTKKKPSNDEIHSPVWDVLFRSEETMPIHDTGTNMTFSDYIRGLLTQLTQPTQQSVLPPVYSHNLPHPPVYVLGDSHVLSLAWQSMSISLSTSVNKTIHRTFVPYPSTGIKAWHFRDATKFFTNYNLHASLNRLCQSETRTILISAGEIDCREGIGGSLLHGYYKNCDDAIENTVMQYLQSVSKIAKEYQVQVLLMPVAPHAYRSEKNGKALGRAKRRETMHTWNDILRRELHTESSPMYPGVFLLDYEEQLRVEDHQSPVGYVLKPSFNADYTHVNSSVVHLIEKSLRECCIAVNII